MRRNYQATLVAIALGLASVVFAQDTQPATHTLLIEAESFHGAGGTGKRILWGENDYKANFANANLSRQAGYQLSGVTRTTVGDDVGYFAFNKIQVPADGTYRLLVRYEAPHGFDAGFEVQVRQGGKEFKRVFGRAESKKLWPFGEGLKPQVVWEWGANENIVWEGEDFEVVLKSGEAMILMAPVRTNYGRVPPANRNIDCFLLTSDLDGLKLRLEKETTMPLASWLTQSGDLWARVTNLNPKVPVKVSFPKKSAALPGEKQGVEIQVAGGAVSKWVEVGHLLPTFAQGRWSVSSALTEKTKAASNVVLEFAVGGKELVADRKFEFSQTLDLAFEPNIREVGLDKGIKPLEQVLYHYREALEKIPATGKPPTRIAVSAISFPYRMGDEGYNREIDRFNALLGLNAVNNRTANRIKEAAPGGVILPIGPAPERIKETLASMTARGQLANVSGFMIGSETANNLFAVDMESKEAKEGFAAFLQAQGIKLEDAGDYHKACYEHELRIRNVMKVSDALRGFIPDALVAINFNSYMVPSEKGAPCLGPTYSFAHTFRRKALTLPWIQDYMFWMPVGWHGMQFLNVDLMRAGIRHYPTQVMAASIMPQSPGNNPRAWRRMFYGHMAHGVNRFDLFQIAPIQVGNLRYHVSDSRMFAEIRKVTHELGTFDDALANSKVAASDVGFYFSEYGDVHGSWRGQSGAGKTSTYAALKLANVPLDVVIEEDLLDGTLDKYKALVVCDAHVSPKAVDALAKWVDKGGLLICVLSDMETAAPDVNTPSPLSRLIGAQRGKGLRGGEVLEEGQEPIGPFHKQDLMNLKPVTQSGAVEGDKTGLGAQQNVFVSAGDLHEIGEGRAVARYLEPKWARNSVVVTQSGERIKTIAYGYSLGLQSFSSSRPIGRYDDFDTPGHSTITEMLDPSTRALVAHLHGRGIGLPRARVLNGGFIETGWLESPKGIVIPIMDWGNEAKTREVELQLNLASARDWVAADQHGQAVELKISPAGATARVRVDGAGALVLRKK